MKRFAVIVAISTLALTAANAQSASPEMSAPRMQSPMRGPAFLALTDINKASKFDLARLPGVGPELADAITKGRPYRQKDELVRRKIIPQDVYDGIKDRIFAAE